MRELTDFTPFCETASAFWKVNVLPEGERIILVEAMSQDLRVTLRNLTVANALRRIEPARLIVYSGADEDWNQIVWTYFNLDEIRQMAVAYGAEAVFDAHRLVDQRVAGNAEELVVAGVDLGGDLPESGIPPETFDSIVYATACRMAKVARLDATPEHESKKAQVQARSHEFARIYDALITNNDVVALVSSHVDYNNFGLAVEAAIRHDVPVLFPQSTGGLKAYALFPEQVRQGMPIRAGLTDEIGEFFEKHIWSNREILQRSRELTMWRAKATLGRPSWWRAGRSYSSVDLRGADDRSVVRTYAARRIGVDAAKPVLSVFNHAVSDALGTNVEAFADLGEWFEKTAEFAAEHDEVNWLFLDHPQQSLYDASDFFDRCARALRRARAHALHAQHGPLEELPDRAHRPGPDRPGQRQQRVPRPRDPGAPVRLVGVEQVRVHRGRGDARGVLREAPGPHRRAHRRQGPDHARPGRAGPAVGLVLPLRERRPVRAGAAVAGR